MSESAPVVGHTPPIQSAPQLLGNFKPVESIWDGIPIPRGGVTALTAQTGHCKTTLATALDVAFCRGTPFAGREVTMGSVLVLAGENPDDYAMHLMATLQDAGLTAQDLQPNGEGTGELLIMAGTFDLDYGMEEIYAKVRALYRELVLVVVDTSAAFYKGEEENGNVEMMKHASLMRELTDLPGRPAVLVLCHPTKNATQDNLLPRGGGAFLTQVDVNLTLWKDAAGIVTLHHGKIRGTPFDPIRFEIVSVELEGVKDCRGKAIYSSIVRHVPDERADQINAKVADDDDRLLIELQKRPGASVRDLGMACGWTNGMGKPMHARVDRRLRHLQTLKLTDQDRHGKWRLTPTGTTEANRLS